MMTATQPTPRSPADDAAAGDGALDDQRRRLLDMLLTSGGDDRIAIDPLTSRNRYGAPRGLAGGEVWFSSSTASAISPRGYAAAARALALWTGDHARAPRTAAWFDNIRARLLALFGASGAQPSLWARAPRRSSFSRRSPGMRSPGRSSRSSRRPVKRESGVVTAAGGRHFLSSAVFPRKSRARRSA